MQEIITEGKTLVEAVDKACRELGVSRDDVTYEVLVQPVKKLFKTIPARVKVSVRGDDISVRDLLRFDEPKEETEKPREQTVVESETKTVATETAAEPAPAEQSESERPKKEGGSHKRRHKKKGNKDNQPKAEPQVKEHEANEAESAAAEPEEEISLEELPVGAKAAFDYLKTVAAGLGADELEYKAVKIRDGVKFIIDGNDAATLIGRRGETMDALQYLCLLVSNRASDDYCKIAIDVASYRNKREKTLEALAKKVANTVIKTRYSKTLEPMNPYERRIVHSTIQGIEGVKSESVGQEPNRRVVILLENGGIKENGGKDRRRSGRGGKSHGSRDNNRSRRERRESDDRPEKAAFEFNAEEIEIDLQQPVKEYQRIDMKTVAPVPEEQPEKSEEKKSEDRNLNLYSRIDL